MHPLLQRPRALAAYLLAWLLAGAVMAVAWSAQRPAELLRALVFALPPALLLGVSALAMFHVCRGFALRPARWMGALGRRFAAAVLLSVFVAATTALWNLSARLFGGPVLLDLAPAVWAGIVVITLMVLLASALVHDALLAHQAAQAAAATEAQSRLFAREMEIRALRHQVDPHFLFNCLNSISALTQLDPGAARAMTIDLAQYFRQTLDVGERERIQLDDELALIARYVAIEQRRMGDKLQLRLDVEPPCGAAWLPPLLLQPLVENAVKHGIRALDQGGCIEIVARHVRDRLELRVSNPVDASARRDASGLGQGLRHLRARLQAQCPGAERVAIEHSAQRFSVHLALPWQP